VIVDYSGHIAERRMGLISGSLSWKETIKKLKDDKQQSHEESANSKSRTTNCVGFHSRGAKTNDSIPLHGETRCRRAI